MNDAIKMQVSAFVDGELPENEAELLLRRMSQDAELRQAVADYLAIGRLIRGEHGIAAADRMHARVAAAIEQQEHPEVTGTVVDSVSKVRAARPLAGAAIAAAVAVVAIFALQQNTAMDDGAVTTPVSVATEVVPSVDAQQERNRQFFLNHAETSSELGANGMNSRVVTLRFSEELTEEPDAEENDVTDESDEAPTQP